MIAGTGGSVMITFDDRTETNPVSRGYICTVSCRSFGVQQRWKWRQEVKDRGNP